MNDLLSEMASDSGATSDKIDQLEEGKLDAVSRLANEAAALEQKLADAEKLIAEVDDDGSGDIDWQEFCKILQSTVANRPTAATMFDQLDTAGVGELTPSVIRAGMVRYEMEHITDQDVDQMIRAIDENNDGMVGLSEFNTALARR